MGVVDLGVPEIGLILLAVFVLFGYKKLPDATRSLGRSLRIFKGEMNGMRDDDTSAATGPVLAVPDAGAVRPEQLGPEVLEVAAIEAEAAALEARARAARARADAEHRAA